MVDTERNRRLLELIKGGKTPNSDEFKDLLMSLETHHVLAKVFLLEGTPFVFEKSPMKYLIFREQVAASFGVGSQDVCIVGSAKLGFSPSPHQRKYGKPFSETSDVDVVIISEHLFHKGSLELFAELNMTDPQVFGVREQYYRDNSSKVQVATGDWLKVKESLRNFVFKNFNPGLLPNRNPLKMDIFGKIGATAGLFLALEPQVFVSKIRGRIFRDWKAAESYYANSLRELKRALEGENDVEDAEDLDDFFVSEDSKPNSEAISTVGAQENIPVPTN